MKTKLNFNVHILNFLIAILYFLLPSNLTAQEKKSTDLKDFKIVVEKTENSIILKSNEGSAWVDLSFSLNNCQPQAVDEYGLTELDKFSYKKGSDLADFLFTITKTENEIILKGIEGTAWTKLSFSLFKNEKQAIDQHGMIKLN